MIAGCAGGIEHIFSPAPKRRVLDNQEFIQLHPLVEKLGPEGGWLADEARDLLTQGVPPHEIAEIPRKSAKKL